MSRYSDNPLVQQAFEHIDEWDNHDQISSYKFLIADIENDGDSHTREMIEKWAREELKR